MGCLAFTHRSSWSPFRSMQLKSSDCGSQDISWRTCCTSLLSIYLWQSLLVRFGSLFCMSTNNWPTSCTLHEVTWGCSMLWSYLPTPPPEQDMTQSQFLSGVQQVWIQSFPSPRPVASPRLKNPVCPRENNWIHTFPKGISAMWNAISLVQDLNSCRRVHFLRR